MLRSLAVRLSKRLYQAFRSRLAYTISAPACDGAPPPALPSPYRVPVGALDQTVVAAGGDGHSAVVLLRAVQAVRRPVIRDHVVNCAVGWLSWRVQLFAAVD